MAEWASDRRIARCCLLEGPASRSTAAACLKDQLAEASTSAAASIGECQVEVADELHLESHHISDWVTAVATCSSSCCLAGLQGLADEVKVKLLSST